MIEMMLFSDGSVNTLSKVGYGACLALTGHELRTDGWKPLVRVKRFEETSSTKLELQTLLWALKEIHELGRKVTVYTDSQNIVGLPGRRERFEKNDYRTKNNRHISNYNLYQEFYRLTDLLDITILKVRGHQVSDEKDNIDRLFSLVDRASREALRGDSGQ
jgi:ribonuclease HI